MYAEALEHAKGYDYSKQCVISLAPGKSIDYLKSVFTNATVVRVMPNTPAVLQKATTTMVKSADNELSKNAKAIFESIGSVDELPNEGQIDEAIPLNGSMPAYLYLFAKAFIESGIKHGIDPETAKSLACNAIIGSANMILESSDSIDTLINNVCSKKGTTIEGLERLYENGFEEAIEKCYDACVRRSKELSGN